MPNWIRALTLCSALVLVHVVVPAQESAPELHARLKELAISGTINVPNSSPADTEGVISARAGYYLTKRDIFGVDGTFFAYSRVTDFYTSGYYRRLIRIHNPRLFLFLGGAAGANTLSYYYWNSGTGHKFFADGEAGVRYYLGRKTAFEVGYKLIHIRGGGTDFASSSSSMLTFGFSCAL